MFEIPHLWNSIDQDTRRSHSSQNPWNHFRCHWSWKSSLTVCSEKDRCPRILGLREDTLEWMRQSPHQVDPGKYLLLTDCSLAFSYKIEACRRTHFRPKPKPRHADRISTSNPNNLFRQRGKQYECLGRKAIAMQSDGKARGGRKYYRRVRWDKLKQKSLQGLSRELIPLVPGAIGGNHKQLDTGLTNIWLVVGSEAVVAMVDLCMYMYWIDMLYDPVYVAQITVEHSELLEGVCPKVSGIV